MKRQTLGIASLLALWISPVASAQDGTFDAHGFELVAHDGDLRDLLTVQRPGLIFQGEWFASGVMEYAEKPLAYLDAPVDEEHREVTVLDNVVALNLSAGVAVADRVRLDLALPVFLASTGPDGESQGAGVGDLRLSGMISVIQPDPETPEAGGGFGLGVVPYFIAPSGSPAKFLGQGKFTGGASVASTYEYGAFTVSGDAGIRFNPSYELDNLTGSDTITAGIGGGYLINEISAINLEANLSTPLVGSDVSGSATAAELILSARQRHANGVHYTVGAATALSKGVSAAQYRLFVAGGFGRIKPPGPKDLDLDGIMDPDDACPEQPETVNQYKDTDGCPDSLSTVDVVVQYDGKPAPGASLTVQGGDLQREEISTAEPVQLTDVMPGTQFAASATLGDCLSGQTVLPEAAEGANQLAVTLEPVRTGKIHVELYDPEDNPITDAKVVWQVKEKNPCVSEEPIPINEAGKGSQTVGPGTYKLVITSNEYVPHSENVTFERGEEKNVIVRLQPSQVRVQIGKIVILDKVFFEYDSDVIKTDSFELLSQVAATVSAHPHVGRVEVGGHTDNKGNDDYNLELSQRRADSVRVFLISQGVDEARLIAKGYGETLPIDTNRTARGRDNNRRVEFNLIDQAPE